VTVSPFGLVRRVRRERGPRPWAGVLIAVGVACFAVLSTSSTWHTRVRLPDWAYPLLVVGGVACAGAGVVFGTGWLTYVCGRALHRWARRPAALLAAGRLTSDPWSGSRTLAVLLLCVLFGAGAAGLRAQFATTDTARRAGYERAFPGHADEFAGEPDPFFQRSMDLVDAAVLTAVALTALALLVVVAEGIVSRRRAYAALVASGVPRGTLRRSILWQTMLPAIPAVLLALVVGIGLARGLGTEAHFDGGEINACSSDVATADDCRYVSLPEVTLPIPVPWGELARDGGIALLGTAGLGLVFLRRSTALEELRTT
jgi:hypothetical protein